MKQILFFSLKEDLLPVLEAFERDVSLKYTRMGQFSKPECENFTSASSIPNLGNASADTTSSSDSFLITRRTAPIKMSRVQRADGTERYVVDQLANSDSVTFTPAGIWSQDVLLFGRMATVSASEASQELMKRFNSAIKKRFTKIKAFWLGAQALVFLNAGKRLTISAQSPSEFDLTLADHPKE